MRSRLMVCSASLLLGVACGARTSVAGTDASDVESGACGELPSNNLCPTMANVGSTVTPTCVVGAPPPMTGGSIADGTYVIASSTFYASHCADFVPTVVPRDGTLVVSPGCMKLIETPFSVASVSTWTTMDNLLTTAALCGTPGSASTPYTATPTTLSELVSLPPPNSQFVVVFQKM